MSSGYSGTPLGKKLGIKEGYNVALVNEPECYDDMLDSSVHYVKADFAASCKLDLIHLFVQSSRQLDELLPDAKGRIRSSGMIWVSWPKKASKIATDVTEDVIRSAALRIGLVDVKVCAVDDIWSGLKLVIPVADRK